MIVYSSIRLIFVGNLKPIGIMKSLLVLLVACLLLVSCATTNCTHTSNRSSGMKRFGRN